MSRKNIRKFSGMADLPKGSAPEGVIPGCMVLEGGAFRGLYGEGVLDALMEEGINLSCTIGVSAGAMNGYNYVSGQIGRSARGNLGYRHDPRYIGLPAMKNNKGIIGFDFIMGEFERLDPFDEERFYRKDRRFIAVATDLETGKSVFFEKGICSDIRQAIRASASMPYLSKPVMADGRKCLDGGCSVKIPYKWAIDEGYEKIVIIKTMPEDHRRKEKALETRLSWLYGRRYPAFAQMLKSSLIRANGECEEISRLKKEGRVFLISPSKLMDINMVEGDMEKLGALYYLGREDAQKAMPALKKYLERKSV